MCKLKTTLALCGFGLWLIPATIQAVVVAIGDSASGLQSPASYGRNAAKLYSNPDELGFFVTESAEPDDEAAIHWLGISHADLQEDPGCHLSVTLRESENQTSMMVPVPEATQWFFGAAGMMLLIMRRDKLVRHAVNCNATGKGMI